MPTTYAMFATDGSYFSLTSGYGVHGFIGTPAEKLVGGPPAQVVTPEGYLLRKKVLALKESERPINIQPTTYFDMAGGVKGGSNNAAELLGMLTAINLCIKYKVDIANIYSDSQYVLKGLSQWSYSWAKHGWRTAKNEPIPNVTIWRKIVEARDKFKGELITTWVKAHAGHVANEAADNLAGIGTSLSLRGADPIAYEVTGDDIKAYWRTDTNRDPLLGLKDIVFMSDGDLEINNTYYMTDGGKDISNVGKKTNITSYGVAIMNEPDDTIDTLIRRVCDDSYGSPRPCTIRLEKSFHKRINKDLNTFGTDILRQSDKSRLDYKSISKHPIVTEGYPVHLILRGLEYIKDVHDVLLAYKDDAYDKFAFVNEVHTVDVTDKLFVPLANGKSLRPTSLIKQATTTIKLPHPRSTKRVRTYSLNDELPNKNRLASFSKMEPKVTLISWRESEGYPFSYGFIIECNTGMAIYSNRYTSVVV